MTPRGGAVGKVRRSLALLAVLYAAVLALSLASDLRDAAREYHDLALFTARSFFQQIVATRRWNALHGGVYVPVTEKTQPNPYLEDPLRDVVTTGGLRLTKLNPAYMTRLISEVMRLERGTQLHMTSLKPLRPGNAPDDWEREALEQFDRGVPERAAVVGGGGEALFRYIAPLATEEPCLRCHAGQGYELGDVRGGIAVSIPFRPFEEGLARLTRKTWLSHLLFLALGLGCILGLGVPLLRRVREVQESAGRIHRLEGLLPICAGCKRIRLEGGDTRDQSSWVQLESYIQNHSDAQFTHGMCPECIREYFGEPGRP